MEITGTGNKANTYDAIVVGSGISGGWAAKELTQKSLPEIGELFGGRDHTTVLHAVRKITADRAKSPECNHEIHVLEQTLKG